MMLVKLGVEAQSPKPKLKAKAISKLYSSTLDEDDATTAFFTVSPQTSPQTFYYRHLADLSAASTRRACFNYHCESPLKNLFHRTFVARVFSR